MTPIPAVHPLVVEGLLAKSFSQRDSAVESARLVLHRGLRDHADATRHVLAAGALSGGTWESVSRFASQAPADSVGELSPESAPWWRALGEITLIHAEVGEDQTLAAKFFAVARALDGHKRTNLMEYWSIAQAQWTTGSSAGLPPAPSWLPSAESDLIALDVLAAAVGRESREWLAQMNARLFESVGLTPVGLRPEGRTAFDRVESEAATRIEDGPLISVVMTTFRRNEEILTSVHSVLSQSWSNLELLIVDDASGPDFEPLLLTLERLDPRVRVIRLPTNSGAYVGRNAAIAHARGEFVTFQDDDDWSHPQRLERQISPMLKDPLVHSTLSHCARTSEDLRFRNAPVPASTKNSSSLMFRARDLATIGGFDTVRKGGDTEFILRLCAALPGRQVVVEETLAFVRQTQGSLSRTDFGAGRSHPSRQEYWEASSWWHSKIALGADPAVDRSTITRSFPAPRRFLSNAQVAAMPPGYDLVIVGDFGSKTPWLSRAWNLLHLALETRENVGVIHLSDPSGPSGRLTRIAPEARRLIHDGRVDRILPTDEVRIKSLVVANASLLEIQDPERWLATCLTASMIADTLPAESGMPSLWSIRDVVASLESMFGITGCRWVASDQEVHTSLASSGASCGETYLPFFIHQASIVVGTRHPHGTPIVGRCTPATAEGWPSDRSVLERVYPDDSSLDVRIFGDARSLRDAGHELPHTWLLFRAEDGYFSAFIQQLDFYLYFGDAAPSRMEHRAMLVAMAAGRIVMVDHRHADAFRGAAVGCTAENVASTIANLHHDRFAYQDQVHRAQSVMRSELSLAAARDLVTLGHL